MSKDCVSRDFARDDHTVVVSNDGSGNTYGVSKNGNGTVPLIKERVDRPPDAQYVTGTLAHDNDHGESDRQSDSS